MIITNVTLETLLSIIVTEKYITNRIAIQFTIILIQIKSIQNQTRQEISNILHYLHALFKLHNQNTIILKLTNSVNGIISCI